MTEEEMKKHLLEALNKDDISQLRFSFTQGKEEEIKQLAYLRSHAKTPSGLYIQTDFLTHKIINFEEKCDGNC